MFLDECEVFLAVAETGSFSQAAKQVHLSRPALTQKINTLETNCGVELFKRTTQGVVLTQAGAIVARHAKRVADISGALDKELAEHRESFVPTLSVGMSDGDGTQLLPTIISAYHDANPEMCVHLTFGHEPALLEMIANQELDLAIVKGKCMNPDFGEQLLGYRHYVCVAPNMPPWNRLKGPIGVVRLLPLPMVIYEWTSQGKTLRDEFNNHYGFAIANCSVSASFDTYDALMKGVAAGLGHAWVPSAVAESYEGNTSVIVLDISSEPIQYPIMMVYFKRFGLSPESLDFLDFLNTSIPSDYFEKSIRNEGHTAERPRYGGRSPKRAPDIH